MKFILILINLSLLIATANAHGYIKDPKPRGNFLRGQNGEYSGGLAFQYYYQGGAMHVCGNNGWVRDNYHKESYPLNTQITGPVVKTYTSGARVLMTAHFDSGHEGHFRMKLCKLNKPTDQATQACFDQEQLKIQSLYYYHKLAPRVNVSYRIDDYTIRTPNVKANGLDDSPWEIQFYVQLPAGLTCENCVLQWDWHQSSAECTYADGKRVGTGSYINGYVSSTTWLPDYGEIPCAHQQFRSCADIKIQAGNTVVTPTTPSVDESRKGCDFGAFDMPGGQVVANSADDCKSKCKAKSGCTHYTWWNNHCYMKSKSGITMANAVNKPDAECGCLNCKKQKREVEEEQSVYRANTVKPLPDLPHVFSCHKWNDFETYYANSHNQGHFNTSLHLNPNKRNDPYKYNGAGVVCFWTRQVSKSDPCTTCRANCMSSDKKCPEECFCRWFPRKLKVYQTPIPEGGWNKDY